MTDELSNPEREVCEHNVPVNWECGQCAKVISYPHIHVYRERPYVTKEDYDRLKAQFDELLIAAFKYIREKTNIAPDQTLMRQNFRTLKEVVAKCREGEKK